MSKYYDEREFEKMKLELAKEAATYVYITKRRKI